VPPGFVDEDYKEEIEISVYVMKNMQFKVADNIT
jgi:dUTPase